MKQIKLNKLLETKTTLNKDGQTALNLSIQKVIVLMTRRSFVRELYFVEVVYDFFHYSLRD